MKKFLAILLALVMTLALVACGQQNDADAGDNTGDEQTTETEFKSKILFCGSTSLYPIISSLASSFTEEYVKWNAVDPSFPEENISIYVAPGGSGVGVSAASTARPTSVCSPAISRIPRSRRSARTTASTSLPATR